MRAVPPSGSLVRKLGKAHARIGMEPMHPKVREYMEGYKEYSLTGTKGHVTLPTQQQRGQHGL